MSSVFSARLVACRSGIAPQCARPVWWTTSHAALRRLPNNMNNYTLHLWRLDAIPEGRRAAADLVNLRGRWTVRPFPAVRVGRCSFVVAISYHVIRIMSTPNS